MRILNNNAYSWIHIIIENTHYCDPDSSPSSTFNSTLYLWTLNSHSENWVWGYFRTALYIVPMNDILYNKQHYVGAAITLHRNINLLEVANTVMHLACLVFI